MLLKGAEPLDKAHQQRAAADDSTYASIARYTVGVLNHLLYVPLVDQSEELLFVTFNG